MDDPAHPPESPDRPAPSVAALARAFDLDPRGASPIRAASRHVVLFPASRLLTVASDDRVGAQLEAMVADLLAEAGAPTTRHVDGPVLVDDWAVTTWREVATDPDRHAGAATLGQLASDIHRATHARRPRRTIPCDPVGAAAEQVARAAALGATSETELKDLYRHLARAERLWHEALLAGGLAAGSATDPGAGAVVHGDLHAGNALVGPDGAVAIDLELTGWGPRAYDAAPTVAAVRWYARDPGDLPAFDAAYGAPLTSAAAQRGLDEVWAVWSTAWAVANRHRSAEAEDEATTRMATLATGEAPRPWRLR